MAAAPWRDHRFRHVDSRRAFDQSLHRGASHGLMHAAGFQPKPQEHVIVTPRTPPAVSEPPATLKLVSPSHTSDPRFPEGLGPRLVPGGLDWRRRSTQELDVSRGVGGGHLHAPTHEMRPAGVSTKRRGEVCMMGWHAYKQTVRHLDKNADKLVSSCPDLRHFLAEPANLTSQHAAKCVLQPPYGLAGMHTHHTDPRCA
eukprot:gb/GFBE01059549.1/.p1 GENE.gb/GFBE01059549.1/~~gb/GFBE01059549.1/.p1  ORF type:complete len:199 (+),score=6.73 gb/GFBE01059549.1/:1-597(+)